MSYRVAVIETEPGETPPELLAALHEINADVEIVAGGAGPPLGPPAAPPDFLLVPAAAPERLLRELNPGSGDGAGPATVVYADSGFEALDRHVLLGRDYVVPPFRPWLLRARFQTCLQRARLNQSLDESQARLRLHAYDRELQIGREIQSGFLPDRIPQPDGWEIDVRFHPARMVAGDFYDAFELVNGRRIAIVVADVCDKGVGAALFMALIRSLLRHTAEHSGLQSLILGDEEQAAELTVVGATPLINAVRGTNGYLTRNHLSQGYFATLFFGVLDPGTGTLVYINGGHNPPVIFGAGAAEPVTLELTGPAVGVVPDCGYAVGHAEIGPGQTLLIYTDGVTEARSAGHEFFGEERLMEVVRGSSGSGAELLDGLERSLRVHVGEAEQFDDITMVAVHRPEEPGGTGLAGEAA
ncbi:PP2C family protein-serine/threonine phosphatase [Actinomadura fibrosa]|uniref:PP2C family protein-serine/threonine phosphatase n=1 Tax=Actinomadura fibrosa TaxID=111802 RepID=A0ABW2XRK1_9ACTN|nr:PP2C family protein-serine/threonine phosphatase [Actinomadura fibrosa]